MLQKAVDRVKKEMETNQDNSYIQVVGNYIINHLEQNPEDAEKVLNENKTVGKSLDEMRKEAEKKKVGNCAVLTDAEGFEVVLKYFDIKVTSKRLNSPAVNRNETKTDVDFDVNLDELLS